MAWAGAALFAGSLLYFLFSYTVTFREIHTGPVDVAAVAGNIGLFAVFAVHHSLFARTPVRALVARAVSLALERSLYVWIASLMLIGVCALWQPLPGVIWQARAPASWLLPAAQAIGAWLALRSAAIIDIWDLAGVQQASEGRPEGRPSFEFKTTGPYGWVRHPIYLGWFLLVWPVATMTTTRLAFAAASCVYVLIAIPFEERSLRRASGGAYEQYMRKVPWRLVPRVY
jgi:protein-S-isoprenylcysteine O-methyltransferase Ste14